LKSINNIIPNLFSVVGYGTFITKYYWKDKFNVEVCKVLDYIRIFPQGYWFPYAIQCEGSSFWALKFDVYKQDLDNLDYYEGVHSNLFERVETQIILKDGKKLNAFIYVPSEETIIKEKLTLDIDKHDRWKEEIKNFPDIIKKFPELF
jgi:hypothetical protein